MQLFLLLAAKARMIMAMEKSLRQGIYILWSTFLPKRRIVQRPDISPIGIVKSAAKYSRMKPGHR